MKNRFADIIAYAHPKVSTDGTSKMVLTLRSSDNSVRCGCRFKHIVPEIDFTYNALTAALNDAIDKEAAETNGQFVTSEREVAVIAKEYDYDSLMKEFGELAGSLMAKDEMYYMPRITQIIDKYFGKGKKISEATIEQAELIHLVIDEIKAELIKD